MKLNKIFLLAILFLWLFLYALITSKRIFSKVTYYQEAETTDSPIIASNQNIEDMISANSDTIKKSDKVLFISEDGLSYLYYNLLSYPTISSWSNKYNKELFRDYDYVIIYGTSGQYPLKNGIYKTYDIK